MHSTTLGHNFNSSLDGIQLLSSLQILFVLFCLWFLRFILAQGNVQFLSTRGDGRLTTIRPVLGTQSLEDTQLLSNLQTSVACYDRAQGLEDNQLLGRLHVLTLGYDLHQTLHELTFDYHPSYNFNHRLEHINLTTSLHRRPHLQRLWATFSAFGPPA